MLLLNLSQSWQASIELMIDTRYWRFNLRDFVSLMIGLLYFYQALHVMAIDYLLAPLSHYLFGVSYCHLVLTWGVSRYNVCGSLLSLPLGNSSSSAILCSPLLLMLVTLLPKSASGFYVSMALATGD